jgi:uncharacterized membrane protein
LTPAWILDIFAAIMLVVAAVSAARLVAARPWQPGAIITDADISHLLMGIAMAGLLASSLTTLPDGAWAVVFGVLMAWFGYRVVRDYRPAAPGRWRSGTARRTWCTARRCSTCSSRSRGPSRVAARAWVT